MSLWSRLPVLVQALIAGALVSGVGLTAWNVFLYANLEFVPSFPFAAVAMTAFLALYWLWLGGRGWPPSTSGWRARSLRGGPLSGRVWVWSLLAGGLATLGLRALLDALRRLSTRPAQDLPSAEELARYPALTVVSLLLTAGAVAGVVEEAAFRGYLQTPLESRYGRRPAILIVGFVFVLAHYRVGVPDMIPWLIFTPAYFLAAVSFGALASITGSIRPGVLLHASLNTAAFLSYSRFGIPRSVWETGWDRSFVIRCIATPVFGIAAIPAYRRLQRIVVEERGALVPEERS